MSWASQVVLVVKKKKQKQKQKKNPPANAGCLRDTGSIPGSERPPGGGHGNPLQYSCLGNRHGQEEPGGLQSIGLQRVGHN